jgi:diguanylate cyclase (GGDEF)-like protein
VDGAVEPSARVVVASRVGALVMLVCALQAVSAFAMLAVGAPTAGALLGGLGLSLFVGVCVARPLVVRPATSTLGRRERIIGRIRTLATSDRADSFQRLLEEGDDPLLGPLARAVHGALTSAHRDRLEAARLRRELDALVHREASRRTAHLQHLSERDELTGLYNRRGFDGALERLIDQARATGEELALIAMDLDHFKRLNDTCGHETGDRALKIIGDLLGAHIREGDLAARIGGDEFFLVMAGTDGPRAEAAAKRIIDLFARHPAGAGLAAPWPGVSAGIALVREHGAQNTAHLKRLADQALYASKRAGRNRATRALKAA